MTIRLMRGVSAVAISLTAQNFADCASAAERASAVEEIIITGTKTGDFGMRSGIPLERVPQSVQVFDEEEIIKRGARSIEDALRGVPSATVARSRIGSGASGTLRLRGFAAYQMRNGIRQRYYQDVDSSALSNVARIEVLKGPSGVLYGQAGVGGIVSIITKQPTETLEGSAALAGGMYGQKMATGDVGIPLTPKLGLRLTGEIERSETFVDHIGLDRENVGMTLAWRPAETVAVHVVTEYLHRSTVSNPGLPTIGTVIGNGVAAVPRSAFLGEPGYSFQGNESPLIQAWADVTLGDGWTLIPRVQYSEFNNTAKSTTLLAPVPGQPTLIQREGRNAGEKDQFYVGQLDLTGEVSIFRIANKLLLGAEYSADRVNFRMQDNVPCGIAPIDALNPVYGCGAPTGNFGFGSLGKIEGFAFYLQDQIALTDDLNVVAGIRHSDFDNDNIFSTAFFASPTSAQLFNTTWQLGATYTVGGGVSVFGGYNTGYDLEWVTGARRADGTPFKPETSDQAEIGVRFANETVRATVSAFRIRRNDVAVPDPLNIGFQIQDGRFDVSGVEVEGEWSPVAGWWLQGGYAHLDGTVARTTDPAMRGARLAETPSHSVTATTRVSVDTFELRAGANYVGARKMLNGGAITLPGYVTVDVGLGAAVGSVRVDAMLTNIFDKTYYYSDNLFVYSIGTDNRVLPGEPRTFSLRLSYEFGGTAR